MRLTQKVKSIVLFCSFLIFVGFAKGQVTVNQYAFSMSIGTYTDISTTGTYIGAGDDAAFAGLPIGFTFTYHCVNFSTFGATTNGFIRLGATPPSGSNGVGYAFAAGTSATDSNAIGGLSADLYWMYSHAGKVWYQTSGVPGSQICTIEWQHMYFWGAVSDYSDDANFQIQLCEGSNVINIIYGYAFETNHYNRYAQIGLRGVANTDYNLINDAGYTLQWSAVTATTTGGNTLKKIWGINNTNEPGLGLTYTWTPPPTSCTTLPIELLSFNATLNEGNALLDWSTASETNNAFFTVEKTIDGVNYEKLAIVDGSGTSTQQHHYATCDKHPFIGISYYRLKQTDFNGLSKYFSPVEVEFTGDGSFAVSVYPVPTDASFLNLALFLSEEGLVRIEIYDLVGNILDSKSIILGKGSNTVNLDETGKLTPGVYIVRAFTNNMFAENRVVIK